MSTNEIFRPRSPAELAQIEREVMRKRELRAALATSLGERVVDGAEFKQIVSNLPTSNTAPVVKGDTPLVALDARETKTLIRSGSSTSAAAFLTAGALPLQRSRPDRCGCSTWCARTR